MIKRHKFQNRIIMMVLVTALALVPTMDVWAVTKKQLQNEKAKAESELKEKKEEVSELEQQEEEAKEQVDIVDEQLISLLAAMDILSEELAAKKVQVEQCGEDYEVAKADEQKQYEAMKARIKFMYEHGDTNYIELLMTSTSFADAVNKADYAEKVYDYDRQLLENYQEIRASVAELYEQLLNEEAELEAMQIEYKEQQEELEQVLAEKQAIVDDFASQLSRAKNEAKKYEEQIRKANTEIAKIAAAEKAARERAAAEAKAKAEAAAKAKAEAEAKAKAEAEAAGQSESSDGHAEDATPTKEESSKPSVSVSGSGTGAEIASFACQFIGNPYVAGGTSLTNGTDCSGFTMSVYSHFGYKIPRTSSQQAGYGRGVSYSEAQAGDIVCYAGHVGIYIGNGMIVHASTPATGIKTTVATYRPILAVRRIV